VSRGARTVAISPSSQRYGPFVRSPQQRPERGRWIVQRRASEHLHAMPHRDAIRIDSGRKQEGSLPRELDVSVESRPRQNCPGKCARGEADREREAKRSPRIFAEDRLALHARRREGAYCFCALWNDTATVSPSIAFTPALGVS
jgi:hypothetical protein